MTSKTVALGGAALALLMVSTLSMPAEARGGGGGGGGGGHGGGFGGGGHAFGGGGFGGGGPAFSRDRMGGIRMGGAPIGARGFVASPRFVQRSPRFVNRRHFRDRNVFVAAPFFYDGYYSYGYGDACYWVRRRALYTGSPYWWNRYNACIYGYGY